MLNSGVTSALDTLLNGIRNVAKSTPESEKQMDLLLCKPCECINNDDSRVLFSKNKIIKIINEKIDKRLKIENKTP